MQLMLKKLRKAKGLRQEDLAERISTTPRIVGAWERGETSLPFEDACRIADVLECSLDELGGRKWSGEKFADPGKNALIGHYDSLNERSRGDLVGFAKSFASDPERRIEKDGAEHAVDQAAV